jgi:REP element-mobilizing transposase RayT
VLVDAVAGRLKELFLEQAEYGYTVMQMEVMPDHVHLLLDVDPRVGLPPWSPRSRATPPIRYASNIRG